MRRLSSYLAALCLLAAVPAPAHDRLAIGVLTNGESQAFEARHLATAMGIPAFVTRDPQEALAQPFVIIAGDLSASEMTPDLVSRLKQFVSDGGTLVIDDPESRAADDLLGIQPPILSTSRHRLHYDVTSGDPGFVHLLAPESQTIVIGNSTPAAAFLTQGLTPARGSNAKVIATFDDGAGAMSVRAIGKGRAYALGFYLYNQVLLTQTAMANDPERWYSDHFEPSADTPQVVIRDWYLAYVPGAIALDPAPDGKSGSLIFTHDVDYRGSIVNMVDYARAERAQGFRATYFMQTKIVKDYLDFAFWDAAGKKRTALIASLGADLGSHTVAHASDFPTFPWGTGIETPENYRPDVLLGGANVTNGRTLNASLLGEMRVSKALIEAAVPGVTVDAFRAGYLIIHPRQYEALAATGYRYDSSYTAGNLMTAFPYRAIIRSDAGDTDSDIVEFPILITDDPSPMMPHLAEYESVLDKEAAFHAVCLVLIHPNTVGEKLQLEMALANYVKSRFWIGDLDTFGDFWRARESVNISTQRDSGNTEVVRIEAPSKIAGLTLNFGTPMALESATGSPVALSSDGRSAVITAIEAGQTVSLQLRPAS